MREAFPKGWVEFLREFLRALRNLPQILRVCAFKTRTIDEELTEATLKGSLRRALDGYHLVSLGLGFVMGSGLFVLTGYNVRIAGPAIVVSYLLAGMSAILAACCYAEFAVEYPVAGQGFTYIMLTFGELPAWIAVTNLVMEYLMGTAATARGFSVYVSRLTWQQSASDGCEAAIDNRFLTGDLDFMAFGITLLLTAVLAIGIRESALVITALVTVHLIMLAILIIAGFTQASGMPSPFLRGGADNLVTAGAHLFFALAGFDVVASASEEARKPEAVPRSIIATTVVSTATYVLMSLFLVLMVPISVLDSNPTTAFSAAFLAVGLNGMYYLTNATALVGIVTSMLVGLFGVARIIVAAARDWLFPPFLATIYPRTQTPLVAQITAGVVVALVALFSTFTTLSDLVSISTALVMALVANALLFRRYYPGLPRLRFSKWGTVESAEGQSLMPFTVPGSKLNLTLPVRQWLVIGHLVCINAFAIGVTVYYQTETEVLTVYNVSACSNQSTADGLGTDVVIDTGFQRGDIIGFFFLLGLWLATTLSMQLLCPLEYEPPKWRIPWWLMPWLPSVTILCMTFTAGALDNQHVYIIFLYFIAGALLVYLFFSLPMSYIKHYQLDWENVEEMTVIQLTFREGRWQDQRVAGSGAVKLDHNHIDASLLDAKLRQARQKQQLGPGGASGRGSEGGTGGGSGRGSEGGPRGGPRGGSGQARYQAGEGSGSTVPSVLTVDPSGDLSDPRGLSGPLAGLPPRPPRPPSPTKPATPARPQLATNLGGAQQRASDLG